MQPRREKMVRLLSLRLHTYFITCLTIASEIAGLREEARAFKLVREALLAPSSQGAAELVFDKVCPFLIGRRSKLTQTFVSSADFRARYQPPPWYG